MKGLLFLLRAQWPGEQWDNPEAMVKKILDSIAPGVDIPAIVAGLPKIADVFAEYTARQIRIEAMLLQLTDAMEHANGRRNHRGTGTDHGNNPVARIAAGNPGPDNN